MALASPRTSAQIIPLPGAALAPIVQRRGPGRCPKIVVSQSEMSRRRFKRDQCLQAQADAARTCAQPTPVENTPAEELHFAVAYFETCDYLRKSALAQLRVAQQQAGVCSPTTDHAGATLYHLPVSSKGARHG